MMLIIFGRPVLGPTMLKTIPGLVDICYYPITRCMFVCGPFVVGNYTKHVCGFLRVCSTQSCVHGFMHELQFGPHA